MIYALVVVWNEEFFDKLFKFLFLSLSEPLNKSTIIKNNITFLIITNKSGKKYYQKKN
jgi:hypothetical protein